MGQAASRQHRFPFLTGDTGRKLPVDGYYESLNLVVEYREKQHSEAVPFFDQRITVSGVARSEQRCIYDERRREVLPLHGIALVEVSYADLCHNTRKKLQRNIEHDREVLREILRGWLPNRPQSATKQ